jgi:hypothetical protein
MDENSYGVCRYYSKDGGHNILEFSTIDVNNLIPSTMLMLPLIRSICRIMNHYQLRLIHVNRLFYFEIIC